MHATGKSAEELRELHVEGATFNPTQGGISGLNSLDRNIEVSNITRPCCLLLENCWKMNYLLRPCRFLSMLHAIGTVMRHFDALHQNVCIHCVCTHIHVWCLQAVAEVCAVCNDAHIEYKDGKYHAVGAPTEAALSVLVEKLGVTDSGITARIQQQRASQSEGHADFVCQAYCRRYCSLAGVFTLSAQGTNTLSLWH